MPPKKAAKASNEVYIVTNEGNVNAVFASLDAANERLETLKGEGQSDAKVTTQTLLGGTIAMEKKPAAAAATAPKKAAAKPKVVKGKAKGPSDDDDDDDDDEEAPAPPPKANTAAKKTKPVEEQRAENAKKPANTGGADLPANVKALLAGKGDILKGMSIIVTGIPPTITRKGAEDLVTLYGGKLLKALSKKTTFVLVGNEAGPKKLNQIAEMGIKTKDEDEFIALLEGAGAGTKRGATDDEDEDDEEEEEVVAKPAKKAKKAKA